MIVECGKCKKRYKINLGTVNSSKIFFKCKFCGHTTHIDVTLDVSAELSQNHAFSEAEGIDASEKTSRVSWNDSIKAKLSAVLIITTLAVLGTYGVYNYYSTKTNLSTELTQYAENTAKRLALTLTVAVWEVDENQASEIIKSEMLDKRIYGVVVYEKDGVGIFQAAGRTRDWRIESAHQAFQGEYIRKTQPIKNESEDIGVVEVFVTERFMFGELIQSTRGLLGTAAIQIIVFLAAIYTAMKKLVINPVATLTSAAEQISTGNLKTNIGIRSRDEIGILAQAIERMQISLRIIMDQFR